MKRTFTLADMENFLVCTYGSLGKEIFDLWVEYNLTYFDGRLKPIAIVMMPTSPHGGWVGLYKGRRQICLCLPNCDKPDLVSGPGVLLHEMIHQNIAELGLFGKNAHDCPMWRAEVERVHERATGEKIFCAPIRVEKERQSDGSRKSVKLPDLRRWDGKARVLELAEYCGWDHTKVWFKNYQPQNTKGHERARDLDRRCRERAECWKPGPKVTKAWKKVQERRAKEEAADEERAAA